MTRPTMDELRALVSRDTRYAGVPGTGPDGETCRTCAHLRNTGNTKAFYKCGSCVIDALEAEVDALTAERDALRATVARVRNLAGYLPHGHEDIPANVVLLAADVHTALEATP